VTALRRFSVGLCASASAFPQMGFRTRGSTLEARSEVLAAQCLLGKRQVLTHERRCRRTSGSEAPGPYRVMGLRLNNA